MIDLSIAAVLLFSLAIGWKQGVVRGLLTLSAMIAALFLAAQGGDIASGVIVEQVIRPAVRETVAQRIEEMSLQELLISPLEEMEQVLDAIENNYVRSEAEKILAAMGLSAEAADGLAKETMLAMSGEVLDTVLYGGVRKIISAIICVLLYAVLSLLLRPVVFVICKIFKLPILRQADQLGGLALGAVRGVLLVLLAVWALRTVGYVITEETIEGSFLLPRITTFLDSGSTQSGVL